ncbi:hypothetical protein [Burkholderia cenocepacia]|uniref:hypothetical protein n=1 Tax=Burkholderia cenocepacia TaxID=95486 RepID=UPI002AAF9E14|nr:hypothetical protein [Burkholderia cenocepacia]
MDIDELLTVEERKDDSTGSLKTGQTHGVRCAGAGLRAINGTLRAVASVRFRTARAAFAVHVARERNGRESCHATPGRGIGDRRRVDRRATPMQWGNLDRPKSCVKRPRAMHSSDERAGPAGRPPRVSADSDSVAQFPDSDFSVRRLAARDRHTILIT